ncbi:MAG: N-terminal domain of oligopeptide transport permease, partial [Thermomicrobiales bacterium]|nr:N-terminal domain of oligopeptide transport permease [Thermomicrobiales bacterium]
MEQTQELVARPTRLRSAEPRSELAKSLRRLARNKGAIGGAVVLALIVLTAIFAPALAPED